MTNRERMLKGLPYRAHEPELEQERLENKRRIYRYNLLPPDDLEEKDRLIRDILGGCGVRVTLEPPIRFDYGRNTYVGENFFANYNLTVLDVGEVRIGKNVMLAPNVAIYTAGHPIHPDARNSGYEYGIGVTIGDNVWIGGNTVINPGVHIGDNVVVGSGSVVTRDIPPNSIAAGNPCRVLREIREEDRKYYFRRLEFDIPLF